MQHKKRYQAKNDTKKRYQPAPMWAAKEKIFDTRIRIIPIKSQIESLEQSLIWRMQRKRIRE